MQPNTETQQWFALRYYHPDSPETYLYTRDNSASYETNRSWVVTTEVSKAYKFHDRADARRVTRSKGLVRSLRRENSKVDEIFWEVIKIVETKQVSYVEEMIVSNAPPLYQLARLG